MCVCVDPGVLAPHLAASVLRVDVSGHREASVQQLLSIVHWSLEEVSEVFILGHLLITCLPPLSHRLTGRQTGERDDRLIMFYNRQ